MSYLATMKAAKAQQTADSVQTQLNQAIAAGDQLAETQQARVDADSKTYTTLKQRLDFEQNQLKTVLDSTKGMDRQSQVLQHGVSVINGEVGSPLDLEIQGRTLVSLGNSVLEDTKKYVLADKKFKVKFSDATTYSGVSKFQGKNERPIIIRIANYEGKIAGSTVENPHVLKYGSAGTGLLEPNSSSFREDSTIVYDRISKLDGIVASGIRNQDGGVGQQLFPFNIIEEIERQVGRIPRSTLAAKVQWVKDNVTRLTCNWWGYGSSVGGNKATLAGWALTSWFSNPTHAHTNGTVTKRTFDTIPSPYLMPDGFAHFLAYAEPSNGTIASTINTDYIELEIELKPDADFTHPSIPLYEVTQAEFDNILVGWDESAVLNRYPRVQSVQHLTNPAVIVEGENLIPPFSEWTLHANARVISPYELELNATGNVQSTAITIPCLPNQQYTISADFEGAIGYIWIDINGVVTHIGTLRKTVTFTTGANATTIKFRADNDVNRGMIYFRRPMLTLGNVAKPFVPRNPSYLYADVKLGQIGTAKDTLYKQDGQWYVRKVMEKDVVLDGSLGWGTANTIQDVYQIYLDNWATANNALLTTNSSGIAISDDGTRYIVGSWQQSNRRQIVFEAKHLYLNIEKTKIDSMGGATLLERCKNYLNENPIKLSYMLATPQTINVSDKVEGDLAINGLTQVEVTSGVVVREKVTPILVSGGYQINIASTPSTWLKRKPDRILKVYKGPQEDKRWNIVSTLANGNIRAFCYESDFDTTAEYTVTYLVLDRHQFTNNATEVKATYARNIRSALDDTIARQADIGTTVSVNTRAIVDIYARLKAGGL